MKIIECCPFFKENLVGEIHIQESARWVDEIHITECNMTHQYKEKPFYFELESMDKVIYHKLDARGIFLPKRRFIPHFKLKNKPDWHNRIFRNVSWYNEGMQRKNFLPSFNDEDILILSDIDEIIDSRFSEEIINEVNKRGIVTVKLHFTSFYFNLFSRNWGGPKDYSYRVFIIKGKKFREDWNSDYDTLRKAGEKSALLNTVYCIPKIAGFHHSWLGDENYISEKIAAYTHTEHAVYNSKEYIKDCLEKGRSIFPDQEVEVDNSIELLSYIEQNREKYAKYFVI